MIESKEMLTFIVRHINLKTLEVTEVSYKEFKKAFNDYDNFINKIKEGNDIISLIIEIKHNDQEKPNVNNGQVVAHCTTRK